MAVVWGVYSPFSSAWGGVASGRMSFVTGWSEEADALAMRAAIVMAWPGGEAVSENQMTAEAPQCAMAPPTATCRSALVLQEKTALKRVGMGTDNRITS